MFALDQRPDAAASGVAENDDMLNLEIAHRELDGGARAVQPGVGCMGRHEVRNVPHDEQFTGLGVGQKSGVDPAVGAGDHEDLRRLTEFDERAQPFRARLVIAGAEGTDAGQEPANGESCVWHWRCVLAAVVVDATHMLPQAP